MLVYMILNEATEMCYVGKTEGNLKSRWREHREAASSGSGARFHVAIREWGVEVWTPVVLQHCTTEQELSIAEGNWIEYLDARNPVVGYNTRYVENAYERYAHFLKGRRIASTRGNKRAAPSVEQFRSWGTAGARTRDSMSPEELQQFKEWGKKGAEKSRRLKELKERMSSSIVVVDPYDDDVT